MSAQPSVPSPAYDEATRQHALDRYRLLDTPPSPVYDDVVRVAAAVCAAPLALISLVDRDRQWFKARTGGDATQTARADAVCDHAIREPGRLLEVEDLRHDARFAAMPAVVGDDGARFYAGMPLVSPEGAAVGTVCVVDNTPRALTDAQRDALAALARITVALMENGRREHEQAAAAAMQPAQASAAHAARDYTVAIVELQDHAGLVARQGERAVNRALEALDEALGAHLRDGNHGASDHGTLNRVTGSTEFVAVLHGDAIEAERTLARLRGEADRQREAGFDLRIGAARSTSPNEAMPLVFLRADEALSAEKTRLAA